MISASLHTGKGGGGGSFANSGYGKRNKLTKENSVAESDQINGEAHPFLHESERWVFRTFFKSFLEKYYVWQKLGSFLWFYWSKYGIKSPEE